MAVTIPGVPETVPRERLLAFLHGLGFEPTEVASLEFHPEGIYAEVYAHDPARERGWRYAVGDEAAKHRVCIRIADESDEKASDA